MAARVLERPGVGEDVAFGLAWPCAKPSPMQSFMATNVMTPNWWM
ncbi:MAG: hypothetical protein WKF30_16220 [Pyrinomonadaceae bacterium]